MNTKHLRKLVLTVAMAGWVVGSQGAAVAADQKQVNADLATAAQLEQNYQNDRQALAQAYRAGANWQTIQNLKAAVTDDISHLRANAQDLENDGVVNPNPVHSIGDLGLDQGHDQRQNNKLIRFRGVDTDNNGTISRNEWRASSDGLFDNYDQNNDGSLTRDEMKTGPHWDPNDNRWNNPQENRFTDLDRNDDGIISRNEWNGPMESFSGLDKDRNGILSPNEFYSRVWVDRFQQLDRNNDGFLSHSEWPYNAQSFDTLDHNQNGQIDHDEFFNRDQVRVAAFSELDSNHDGVLLRDEWRSAADEFNRLDINGNNILTEDEFYSRQSPDAQIQSSTTAEQIIQQIFSQVLNKK